MDKFAYLKYAERKENIHIESRFVRWLPQYFQDKYIVKKNPLIINDIEYLGVEGFEIILPLLKEEVDSPKYKLIIEDTIYKLEDMKVKIIAGDIKSTESYSKIITTDGKSLMSFFIFQAIIKVLKFTKKDIKYAEVIIIDNEDTNSTYNIVEAIYEQLNYLTIFTQRPEYFEDYIEKIYSDTGLNLQITEQNKSALKEADIIINLSCSDELNFDYFYKKGSIYFELSNNSKKTLELLRKRQDMNIIDDLIISCNTKPIKNNLLEAILYIKDLGFRDFFVNNQHPESGNIVTDIIKMDSLNIVGFCQYGNIIRQYKS